MTLATLHDFDDCRPVELKEAARLAGRSVSWVRECRTYGPLEPALIEGRHAVTARSLARYLASRADERHRKTKRRKPPMLRLVVDNT